MTACLLHDPIARDCSESMISQLCSLRTAPTALARCGVCRGSALVVRCDPCYSAALRFARIAMQPRENVYESRNLRHWYGIAHGRTHGYQQRLAGRTAASVGDRAAAGLHAWGPSHHAQRWYLPGLARG